MKRPPRQRPVKDERDEQISVQAKGYALEFMIAATQVLTIMCFVKGSLSLLFFGAASERKGFLQNITLKQYFFVIRREIFL